MPIEALPAIALGLVTLLCACHDPPRVYAPPGGNVEDGPRIQEGLLCDRDFGDPTESPYVLPFPEGKTYQLEQGYCAPDPSWGHHGWFAYDFDLATGDTVIASRAGEILFVREDQPDIGGRCGVGGENLIVVEHEDGSVMHYVHLTIQGALVSMRDRVVQGQAIGSSGNSGCSSGPHLHVYLFPSAAQSDRLSSQPFNYSNAIGPLDEFRGLVQGQDYTAGSTGG